MSARSSVLCLDSVFPSPEARVAAYDWQAIAGELDNYGCAALPKSYDLSTALHTRPLFSQNELATCKIIAGLG